MKRYFKRIDIQNILELNEVGADVYYLEREEHTSDCAIVYYRNQVRPLFADDKVHMKKISLTVAFYRKKKLDSIEKLMDEHFNGLYSTSPTIKDNETDYFINYYDVEFFSDSDW